MGTCEYEGRCLNVSWCYRCQDRELLRLPEDKVRRKRQRQRPKQGERRAAPWRGLEEEVARRLSATPTVVELAARRQPGSGNQFHRPGDGVDEVVLVECKERAVTTRGEKSHVIHLESLEKAAQEAGARRKPLYVFRFPGTGRTYGVFEFDDLLELIHEVKVLRAECYNLGAQLQEAYRVLKEAEADGEDGTAVPQ